MHDHQIDRISSPASTLIAIETEEARLSIWPSSTPVTCSPLPPGIRLVITPVSSSAVHIEMDGLQPGERLKILFTAQTESLLHRIEARPLQSADSNGHFIYEDDGLKPLLDGIENKWKIQIAYSRGAICTEIVLEKASP